MQKSVECQIEVINTIRQTSWVNSVQYCVYPYVCWERYNVPRRAEK